MAQEGFKPAIMAQRRMYEYGTSALKQWIEKLVASDDPALKLFGAYQNFAFENVRQLSELAKDANPELLATLFFDIPFYDLKREKQPKEVFEIVKAIYEYKGDLNAGVNLALMYISAYGTDKDATKGVSILNTLNKAPRNKALISSVLSYLYSNGIGVQKNLQKATFYANEKSFFPDYYQQYLDIIESFSDEHNLKKGVQSIFIQKAYKNKKPIIDAYLNARMYAKILDLVDKNIYAKLTAAEIYFYGTEEIKKDYAKSYELFSELEKSKWLGDGIYSNIQSYLFICKAEGLGTKKDMDIAKIHLENAISGSDANAYQPKEKASFETLDILISAPRWARPSSLRGGYVSSKI